MNSSKKHDERFWKKWYTAGAVKSPFLVWLDDDSEANIQKTLEYVEKRKREVAEKLSYPKDLHAIDEVLL